MNPTTTLWYDTPGTGFCQGLPLGNGRLGMTVLGGIRDERIVLNEESMWSGSPKDNDRPEAHGNLPKIRELLLAGNNPEAEALVNETFTCLPPGSSGGRGANVPFGCFQTLGNLHIEDGDQGTVADYRRVLDLSTAVAAVSFKRDDVRFTREYLVSEPDQVGVIHCTADRAGQLSLEIGMDRPERSETAAVDGDLLMTGTLPDGKGGDGVSYAARVRVLNSGGTVAAGGTTIKVTGADELVILFSAETDYDGNVPCDREAQDPVEMTRQVIAAAVAKPFDAMLAAHIREHRSWFDRAALVIADDEPESAKSAMQTTDRRLVAVKEGGADPSMAALYFNYGRYLLIGSSRPGTLPANLQGIWAEHIQNPWNGDWHLDINVQMNYWPAELAGLSECHMPMLKLIESLQVPGRETAKAYYDACGWIAHVITNPWGFTAPGENASWGAATSGSAWLCEHLWEHYAFTRDREYLAWAYPIMKGSAQFYVDMLIEEPDHKWLVTAPSNSPENAFLTEDGDRAHICMGPTIDMQLLRELFGNCIKAATILGVDDVFRQELTAKRGRLAPNQIGPDGRLQEWLAPYEEPEPHHRHVAHLYGLHPYDEISVDTTPALAAAARKSLERRGDAANGWSLAWKMNVWARLRDGNRAEKLFRDLLNPTEEMELNYDGSGSGSYANLFCACPPFQIDGNLGGAAGIAEMLVQSRWSGGETDPAELILLPALPDAWPNGEIKGIHARGGIVVDMKWEGGELVSATIHSRTGADCDVRYEGQHHKLEMEQGQRISLVRGDLRENSDVRHHRT